MATPPSGIERRLGQHTADIDALYELNTDMDKRLKRVEKTTNDHTRILNEHTRTLDEHTQILNGHTRLLDGHTDELGGIKGMLEEVLRRLPEAS